MFTINHFFLKLSYIIGSLRRINLKQNRTILKILLKLLSVYNVLIIFINYVNYFISWASGRYHHSFPLNSVQILAPETDKSLRRGFTSCKSCEALTESFLTCPLAWLKLFLLSILISIISQKMKLKNPWWIMAFYHSILYSEFFY
ncbi:unnamed protein product [Blepharisma stoltei]|uniref:Uncharacterized protein n=1 Tax=Blepharisma stoltei TaxID=1481888 RepID=A0AAU9K1M5_9CILI|nr:unnamed protein product [Blepharisma stoltei]